MDTTSQTSSPQVSGSTAVARQSYAISFNLHDRDLQHVLYILDDPQGQHLTLQLTNTSGRDIVLAEKGSVVDATHHHFELRFRPGALKADSLDLITLAPEGWKLNHSAANAEGPVSLFLLSTTERTLEAGKELTLELEHVNADGRGGSRGTNVELRHKNLNYSGPPPEAVASTPRLEHLSLINHRGQKHIPLHVGFVGSDTILNDGRSPNELTLRITNVLKDRSISLKGDTKFILSFDVYQGAEQKEWALAEVTNVANIRITSEVWKKNNGRWGGSAPATIPRTGSEGQSPEWPLQLAAPVELGPGEYLLLNIKELLSGAPSGHANLYVRYENIPGYWDGQFVCVIEKGPLVYRGDKVGIGTAHPANRLDVAGGAAVGRKYAEKFAAPADGLIVQGNAGIGTTSPGAVLQVGDQPANDGGQGFGNGVAAMFTCAKANFGQGPETVMVLAREGVSGSSYANIARFDLGMFEGRGSKSQLDIRLSHDNLDAEQKKTPVIMSLRSNGNVGIGKNDPKRALDIFSDESGYGMLRLNHNSANAGEATIGFFDTNARAENTAWVVGVGGWSNTGDFILGNENEGQGGNVRLLIERSGRVGIGTTNPESTLQLGNIDNDNVGELSVAGRGSGHWRRWSLRTGDGANEGDIHKLRIRDNTAGSDRLVIDGSGNAGIGTTSPQSTLQVGNTDGDNVGELSVAGRGSFTENGRKKEAWRRWSLRTGEGSKVYDIQKLRIRDNNAGTTGMTPADRLVIDENGNVGIGPVEPTGAKLAVSGYSASSIGGTYNYLNRDGTGHATDQQTDCSIWASNRILASEFDAHSDERIKNIQGRSDSAIDFATLLGIEVTDFSYKDVIGKGSGLHKKLIAQQIEKVFPQAVSKQTDVVPDIYQQASSVDGWVELATDLKKGERVRLISDKAEGIYEVLEVAADKFRTEFKAEGQTIFVYGREVNDFRSLDYDAIAVLNVSATQQLKKEKDEELNILRAEIAELKAANNALQKRLQLLESKLVAVPNGTAARIRDNGCTF